MVELLRLIGGSPHWWDSSFGGSVASTMALRERLLYVDSAGSLIWVGGDANMNGAAAGYAVVPQPASCDRGRPRAGDSRARMWALSLRRGACRVAL